MATFLDRNQLRRKSGCIKQPPAIKDRTVKPKEVSHARLISPSNVFRGDTVPALFDAVFDTSHRHVRTWQP